MRILKNPDPILAHAREDCRLAIQAMPDGHKAETYLASIRAIDRDLSDRRIKRAYRLIIKGIKDSLDLPRYGRKGKRIPQFRSCAYLTAMVYLALSKKSAK